MSYVLSGRRGNEFLNLVKYPEFDGKVLSEDSLQAYYTFNVDEAKFPTFEGWLKWMLDKQCLVNYEEFIDNMTWSYTRIDGFSNCPYQWYLKYCIHLREERLFYSSYGSFMHKILEKYYHKEIKKENLVKEWINNYSTEVKAGRINENLYNNYLNYGIEYLSNFKEFPYELIDVELKMNFEVLGKYSFTGFIDYLGRDQDGKLVIIDHKSANMKPRTNRKKPVKTDILLDEKLKQQYIYAEGVRQIYGEYPVKLCFNCFRVHNYIEEPFKQSAFDDTMKWVETSINDIKNIKDFKSEMNGFKCVNICGVNEYCRYHQEEKDEYLARKRAEENVAF